MSCFYFLQYIDSFSNQNTFRFRDNDKYSTKGGVLVTLFIYMVSLASFCFLTSSLYARTDPQVILKQSFEDTVDPENFGPDNFYISASIVNFLSGQIVKNTPNKTFYTVIFKYYQLDPDNYQDYNYTITNIPAVDCGQDSITSYCPDPIIWQQSKTVLYGTQQQSNFSFFSVIVEKCVKGKNLTCASQSEMDEQLSSQSSVVITSADYKVDHTRAGNPYFQITRSDLYSITNKQATTVSNFYKVSETKTTENFYYYFGNTFTSTAIQYSASTIKLMQTTKYNEQEILQLNFILLQDQDTYYRTYSNILYVFGAISGLFKSMTLICGLFLRPIVLYYQHLNLVNLWYFSKRKNNILQWNEQQKDVRIFFNNKIRNLNIPQQQRNIMIDQGIKEVTKLIDIQTYLHTLQEIENLKFILLTEEQRTLMNFIKNPQLAKVTNTPVKTTPVLIKQPPPDLHGTQKDLIFNNLLSSYQIINAQVRYDPISKKIIEMLDPQVLQNLDEANIQDCSESSQIRVDSELQRGRSQRFSLIQQPKFIKITPGISPPKKLID